MAAAEQTATQMISNPKIPSTTQSGDCDLCKCYRVCSTAMGILADIVTVDLAKRRSSSTLVRFGHFRHGRMRVTAQMLGPMRVDGGLLLLTQTAKGEPSRHRVYFVDELYQELDFNVSDTDYASNLYELIEKAI